MAELVQRTREQAVRLGSENSLVGILSQPTERSNSSGRFGVLFVNAGIIHRVGPNRMHVSLARALAGAGISSLRFDLSGIGDSSPRAEVLTPLETALKDIQEAADWFLAHDDGITSLYLFGLCSGADHAAMYAKRDPRVTGLILIDPSIPTTAKSKLNSIRNRFGQLAQKSPGEVVTSLQKLVKRNLVEPVAAVEEPSAEDDLNNPEVRAMLEAYYRHIAENEIRTLAICTGDQGYLVNYDTQIQDAFPDVDFGSTLMIKYYPDFDHTLTAERHREQFQAELLRWLAAGPADTMGDGSTLQLSSTN